MLTLSPGRPHPLLRGGERARGPLAGRVPGLPVAKRGDDVTYGKDGINPLRPEEWISTLKASGNAPHLWPASSGGGAPGHHSGNGQQIDWSKLPPAERLTAFRAHQEASRTR